MRVVLLALDGDVLRARRVLEDKFPEATIVAVSRSSFETGSVAERLNFFRTLRADIFAVSIENLASQHGQNKISLLATLTGASELVLLDAQGRFSSESRGRLLLKTPGRVSRDAWLSSLAIMRSRRELARLEKAANNNLSVLAVESKSNPEIAFLRATPGPGTQAGGASSHITGFINAVRKEGIKIRVIANDQIAGLNEATVPFTLIPLQPYGSTRSAFDLRNNLVFTQGTLKALAASPPDLIYQRYSRFTWAGVAASLSVGRPLFLEYNGSEVWVGKHWDNAGMLKMLERVEQLNLKMAQRIFVVAEVERQNLLRAGVPDKRIVVNPNGVDPDVFRPGVGGEEVRKRLALDDQDVLVGFVGSFGPWHGVVELVKAAALIPEDLRLHFIMIGSGKLRQLTEDMVTHYGLQDRVTFTGSVAHDEVPALLDACDILASPHVQLDGGVDFFGSPTKLFEYMAMGKAIVASNLGQIGEVLTHEETALLVEPGDVHALADAITRLAGSQTLRDDLGKTARRLAIERYTWTINAKRVLEEYRSL